MRPTFLDAWHGVAGRASLAAAIVLVAFELLTLARPDALPYAVKLAAIATYFLVSLPRQRRIARTLGILVAGLLVASTVERTEAAVDNSLFIMSLFLALSLMAASATRSPDTGIICRAILARPVSRVYLPLTLATHLFAIALNVGSVAIFMALLGSRSEEMARRNQLRPLALAVMRGFAAMPFWAPFSISVALTLSILGDLHYLDLMPYGLAVAALSLLAGWLLDGRSTLGEPDRPDPRARMAQVRLLLRIVALTAAAWIVELAAGLRFVEAILIVALAGGGLWWITTRRLDAAGPAGATARRRSGPENEIVVVGAAAFLGQWVAVALNGALDVGSLSPLQGAVAVSLLPLLMFLLGIVGANPIVSGSLLGGLLAPLVPADQHLYLGLAMLCGWGVTSSASPFTGNVLLGSRLIGCSPFVLAVRWNGAFAAVSALAIGVALFLLQL